MTDIDEIAAIVERAKKQARSEGYAEGYQAARDAINAALDLPPVNSRGSATIEMPIVQGTSTTGGGNTYPAERSKRGERDGRVLEIFRSGARKLKQSQIVSRLHRDGDKVSPSSMRVVLTRLTDQGHLTRDGKFYVLAESSSDGEADGSQSQTASSFGFNGSDPASPETETAGPHYQ